MRVKYIGPLDGVRIPLPTGREVGIERGGVLEVSDPLGRSLIEQQANWEQVADQPAPAAAAPGKKPAAKADEKEG
jgi:hypothetical protein